MSRLKSVCVEISDVVGAVTDVLGSETSAWCRLVATALNAATTTS